MAIYTIGDLHLAFKENKPMDIFGLFSLNAIPNLKLGN